MTREAASRRTTLKGVATTATVMAVGSLPGAAPSSEEQLLLDIFDGFSGYSPAYEAPQDLNTSWEAGRERLLKLPFTARWNLAVEKAQRADLLFDNLRQSGVREIRIAGEYGFDPWDTDPACLGVTSQALTAQGFKVRGISGSVFPPKPPAKPDDPHLARNLFDRAIPFDEALHA